MMVRALVLAWVAATIAAVASPAAAQTFPSKAVTFIVPASAGGPIDILARALQPQLQAMWGHPVLVDYKPGVNGVLGTDYVAKALPDGHTVGFVATPHVINPGMRQMPFDTARDLSGVGMLGISNVLISATAGFPANTFQEAIALIKANPKKFSYASPGSGSALHLAMELLKQKAGIEMLHVPFRGNALMYPEVLAGRVDLMADPLYTSLRYVRTGKIKALALAGNRRSDLAPEIPTVSELAIPGFDVRSIFAVVVSSRTPRDIVQKLHSDLAAVLRLPDTQKRMVELGIEPQPTTPEQLDAQFRSDLDRWAQLVKSAGITID